MSSSVRKSGRVGKKTTRYIAQPAETRNQLQASQALKSAHPAHDKALKGSSRGTSDRDPSTTTTTTLEKKQQDLPTRDHETQDFIFKDYPLFRPNLSPAEVLSKGSFGGGYFRPIKSGVTGITYTTKSVIQEFPKHWFEGLEEKMYASSTYNVHVNSYREKCGGGLDMWEESGWIRECDPYGWFQWYCRFFLGRRCVDDERQISRGMGVMGPKGRWRRNLVNKCVQAGAAADNAKISPKIRQLLQHWAFELKPWHLN